MSAVRRHRQLVRAWGTTDKTQLWPVVFQELGNEYGYATSFLLEDSAQNVAQFVARGGEAHRYVGDNELAAWLATGLDWGRMGRTPGRMRDEPRRRIL